LVRQSRGPDYLRRCFGADATGRRVGGKGLAQGRAVLCGTGGGGGDDSSCSRLSTPTSRRRAGLQAKEVAAPKERSSARAVELDRSKFSSNTNPAITTTTEVKSGRPVEGFKTAWIARRTPNTRYKTIHVTGKFLGFNFVRCEMKPSCWRDRHHAALTKFDGREGHLQASPQPRTRSPTAAPAAQDFR